MDVNNRLTVDWFVQILHDIVYVVFPACTLYFHQLPSKAVVSYSQIHLFPTGSASSEIVQILLVDTKNLSNGCRSGTTDRVFSFHKVVDVEEIGPPGLSTVVHKGQIIVPAPHGPRRDVR